MTIITDFGIRGLSYTSDLAARGLGRCANWRLWFQTTSMVWSSVRRVFGGNLWMNLNDLGPRRSFCEGIQRVGLRNPAIGTTSAAESVYSNQLSSNSNYRLTTKSTMSSASNANGVQVDSVTTASSSPNTKQSPETAQWTKYLPQAFGIRENVRNSPYRWCVRESSLWGIATGTAMSLYVLVLFNDHVVILLLLYTVFLSCWQNTLCTTNDFHAP